MKASSHPQGFTITELVVALVVVGVLLFIIASVNSGGVLIQGQMTQALSHAKLIQLAAYMMGEDGRKLNDASIGWPGDLVTSGTMQCRVTDFVKLLIENNYLQPQDLRVFQAAGIKPFTGSNVNQFSASPGSNCNCAYTIYCVQKSDTDNAILLSTINATLNVSNTTFSMNANAQPFGDNEYVLMHKDGSGSIMRKAQATNPALQGTPCKMALSGKAALRAE